MMLYTQMNISIFLFESGLYFFAVIYCISCMWPSYFWHKTNIDVNSLGLAYCVAAIAALSLCTLYKGIVSTVSWGCHCVQSQPLAPCFLPVVKLLWPKPLTYYIPI